MHDHKRAFLRQRFGNRLADAGAAARHQSPFALKLQVHSFVSSAPMSSGALSARRVSLVLLFYDYHTMAVAEITPRCVKSGKIYVTVPRSHAASCNRRTREPSHR